MARPIDRGTAEHYSWGAACDGWHLVDVPELSVIEERMPPGTSETRHAHARARQFFFVLAGTLSIELDAGTVDLQPFQGLDVAPGTTHRVHNGAGVAATFLVISHPPARGDRIQRPSRRP